MSVNGPNNNLKLNISFKDTYKKNCNNIFGTESIMTIGSANAAEPGMKGLEVQQDRNENYNYEYYENGNIKTKKIINPETGETDRTWNFDENGVLISELISLEGVFEYVHYTSSGKIHIFYDKDTQKPLSSVYYDTNGSVIMETGHNKETGFPEFETVYDTSTGKKVVEREFNPNVNGQILKIHEIDERFPEAHYENQYDENNKLMEVRHYNKEMHLVDLTKYSDDPLIREKEYYNPDGSTAKRTEIVAGHELHPVATALAKDFSDENIRKIDCDNVVDVLNDYSFRNRQIEAAKDMTEEERELLREAFETDRSKVDVSTRLQSGLLEKIFQNPDKEQRSSQIQHIVNALKEKFLMVKQDSADLYCDNKEAVDKGITYICRRLDLCDNVKLQEAQETLEIAVSMLENNDLFIDAANGEIDKINYQGVTGDCWLLAALNGIAETPNGKKLISECISVNPETQDVTVKLEGGKKEYLITQDDILKSGRLSKGDADLRAMEIAFKRYYEEMQPPQTLDGGYAVSAFEILTGNQPSLVTTVADPNNPQNSYLALADGLNFHELNPQTISEYKNKPLIVLAGYSALDELEKLQPNIVICADARTSEFESHQYWIRIDGDNIIVKESHNSSNEKVYTREEFLNNFNGGLNVMVL